MSNPQSVLKFSGLDAFQKRPRKKPKTKVIIMIYLSIGLSAIFSFAIMFILAKLMGARQISQLSMFDYINGITIGSIAADLALAESMDERGKILIAVVIYALATLLLSVITDKSITARRFITGKPIILVEHGKYFDKNFKRAKVDINEFLTQCRNNGYFDISQVDTAILEPNGKISIMPVSSAKPVTPSDLNISVGQETLCANVIIDGNIMPLNLQKLGYNEEWLRTQLANEGFNRTEDIFLATCRPDGTLCVYLCCGEACKEIFM